MKNELINKLALEKYPMGESNQYNKDVDSNFYVRQIWIDGATKIASMMYSEEHLFLLGEVFTGELPNLKQLSTSQADDYFIALSKCNDIVKEFIQCIKQ